MLLYSSFRMRTCMVMHDGGFLQHGVIRGVTFDELDLKPAPTILNVNARDTSMLAFRFLLGHVSRVHVRTSRLASPSVELVKPLMPLGVYRDVAAQSYCHIFHCSVPSIASSGVKISAKYQGSKGMFSQAGLFNLLAEGVLRCQIAVAVVVLCLNQWCARVVDLL